MKVLFSSASFSPAYGGPAYTVPRLAAAVSNVGVETAVWAPDGTSEDPSLDWLPRKVVRLNGQLARALDNFGGPDLFHDSGIWLPHNHGIAKYADAHDRPFVVSTRGMLEPWALKHKRFKKKLAWSLYQRRDLTRASFLHATGQAEASNLDRLRLGVPIKLVVNGIDLPNSGAATASGLTKRGTGTSSTTKTALFLGRIHPVKGLSMLVEAWAQFRPKHWQLRIAGPDEDGHRATLERAVRELGLVDVVSFVGPVSAEEKEEQFATADLLILPSYSESFGMVVAEALAHGLPVLATRGTPWWQLVERDCGWWVDATVASIADGLRQATDTDDQTLRAMGGRGQEWIARDFSWHRVATEFVCAYQELI